MDGTQLHGVSLRPGAPTDAAELAAMLRLLSPGSSYLRFLTGLGDPKPWLVRGLLATGPARGAVLAVLPSGTVVGHACWSVARAREADDTLDVRPTRDPRTVSDVGVVVADGWQRQGLGRALFQAAVIRAAAAGGTVLHLDVHPENRRLLASLRRRMPTATRRFADGLVTFDLDLADVVPPHPPHPPQPGAGGAPRRDLPAAAVPAAG